VSRWNGLADRLRSADADLQGLVDRVARQLDMAQRTGDDAYLDALAFNLQRAYAAIDLVLESIGIGFDGGLPKGPNRQYDLLRQMAAPVPGARPGVLAEDTLAALDELRRFHDVIRYAYSLNLDTERVSQLAAGLPACMALVRRDLETFAAFLQALDDS